MKDYQIRVVMEKKDLDDKINKLSRFFQFELFPKLPEEDQKLLIEQHMVMHNYSNILLKRIERFA